MFLVRYRYQVHIWWTACQTDGNNIRIDRPKGVRRKPPLCFTLDRILLDKKRSGRISLFFDVPNNYLRRISSDFHTRNTCMFSKTTTYPSYSDPDYIFTGLGFRVPFQIIQTSRTVRSIGRACVLHNRPAATCDGDIVPRVLCKRLDDNNSNRTRTTTMTIGLQPTSFLRSRVTPLIRAYTQWYSERIDGDLSGFCPVWIIILKISSCSLHLSFMVDQRPTSHFNGPKRPKPCSFGSSACIRNSEPAAITGLKPAKLWPADT